MLDLRYIKQYYPERLQGFDRELLREYLQCVMLQILYDSPLGRHFIFLGGTCLRLVHDNSRFSEDLDFDNLAITSEQFDAMAELMQKQLTGQGYHIEI